MLRQIEEKAVATIALRQPRRCAIDSTGQG